MISNEPKKYLPAREAGKLVGYTGDYVTRLAREQKLVAMKGGNQWFVDIDSLKLFQLETEAEKRRRKVEIREERLRERYTKLKLQEDEIIESRISSSGVPAILETVVVLGCFLVVGNLVWLSFQQELSLQSLWGGFVEVRDQVAAVVVPDLQLRTEPFLVEQKMIAPESMVITNTETQETLKDSNMPTSISEASRVSGESQQSRQELKEMFSDEVRIDFVKEDEGVVVPVFKEKDGEAYRVLFVPTEEKN